MRINLVINEAMRQSGLSMSAAAKRCGIDKSNLSKFLRGKSRQALISVGKLEKLLEALDVKIVPPEQSAKKPWVEQAEALFPILKAKLKDIEPQSLHQILLAMHRPMEERHFLLKKRGSSYVF